MLCCAGVTACLVDFGARESRADGGVDAGPDAAPSCGDGVQEGLEACDGSDLDGRTCESETGIAGGHLACDTSCVLDLSGCEACGNGALDGAEECDDGNAVQEDGCDGCQVGAGWTCSGEPSLCGTVCGDGLVLGAEGCDDGNAGSGDGCGPNCQVEPGWNCTGEPSQCVNDCGDGVLGPGEVCDDGNLVTGDGCDDTCAAEVGWSCSAGSPTVCLPVCGDGLVRGGEECDDENLAGGDGCSTTCEVEAFSACDGEPSECACVVYVNQLGPASGRTGESWALALEHPGYAISAAAARAPCEVWVGAGSYYVYVTSVTNTIQLPADVGWYGGFAGSETARAQRDPAANVTVLSGREAAGDQSRVRHVLTATSVQGVVVDGFSIVDGYDANLADGGGLMTESSDVQVADCVFEGHRMQSGGAIWMDGGTLVVDGCTFLDNEALMDGGAIEQRSGNITVRDSRFEDNVAGDDGGAMSLRSGTVTLESSWFLSNLADDEGGAIRIFDALATLTNVVVAFSTTQGPGGALYAGNNADALLVHVTFWENEGNPGNSISVDDGNVAVHNAILWGTSPLQLSETAGSIDLFYSVVRGFYSGTEVTNADPALEDPANGDFRPTTTSPAIDAGDGAQSTAADIEGHPRVDITTEPNSGVGTPDYVDRGALERQL